MIHLPEHSVKHLHRVSTYRWFPMQVYAKFMSPVEQVASHIFSEIAGGTCLGTFFCLAVLSSHSQL